MSEHEPEKTQAKATATPDDAANANANANANDAAAPDAAAAPAAAEEADAAAPEAEAPPEQVTPEQAAPVQATPEQDTASPWSGGDAAEAHLAEEDAGQRIEGLEVQVAELNDKLLRSLAETENVRRRAQRDKEDAAKYGIKNFAEGMLSVADNLGRAMASIDADARAKDPNLDNLYTGVEMVRKDLVNTFERYGIAPIKALGAKFDPMQHEAMFEVENKDTMAGTITQVLEPGYTLHGRTLRAAKVGITKGGPKEAPAPAPGHVPGGADAPDANTDAADTDPAAREGQAAYETRSEPKPTSGGNLDQEL